MSTSVPVITAIICTHNPRAAFLNRVLAALEVQTLPREQWELLIVDSGSTPPVTERRDLQISAGTRLVRLDRPGLALARRAGAEAARAELLASVDDDTVFNPDYLKTGLAFLHAHPEVANCGGRFVPEFESPPPPWFRGFEVMIAIRDLGPDEIIIPGLKPGQKAAEFPHAAPIGVCVTRREAYFHYLRRWASEAGHAALGRSGKSLASGEDNDYALCCLEAGWSLAYVPGLHCRHLMPASRLDPAYLARLNRGSSHSWVRMLDLHGLRPWPAIARWTVPLRQMRAWFSFRAWAGPAEHIRWQGACGQFEGQAELPRR
jgi:glycosyltransferase involved in cell wall biosynthesis